jgi:hypothetical protein
MKKKLLLVLFLFLIIEIFHGKKVKQNDFIIKAKFESFHTYKKVYHFITANYNSTTYLFRYPYTLSILETFIEGAGIDFIRGDFGYGRCLKNNVSHFCKVDLIKLSVVCTQIELSNFVVFDDDSFYLFGFLKNIPTFKLGGVSKYNLNDLSVVYKNPIDIYYDLLIAGQYDPNKKVIWVLKDKSLLKYRVLDGTPILEISLGKFSSLLPLKRIFVDSGPDYSNLIIHGGSSLIGINTNDLGLLKDLNDTTISSYVLSRGFLNVTLLDNRLIILNSSSIINSNSTRNIFTILNIYNTSQSQILTKDNNINENFVDIAGFDLNNSLLFTQTVKGVIKGYNISRGVLGELDFNIEFTDIFEFMLPTNLFFGSDGSFIYFQTWPFSSTPFNMSLLILNDLSLSFSIVVFEDNTKDTYSLLSMNPNIYFSNNKFYASSGKTIFLFTKPSQKLTGLSQFINVTLDENISTVGSFYFDDLAGLMFYITNTLPSKIYQINMTDLSINNKTVYEEGVDNLNFCAVDKIDKLLICIKSSTVNSEIIAIDTKTIQIVNRKPVNCSFTQTHPIVDRSRNSLYISCLNIEDQPLLIKLNLSDFSKKSSIEVLSKDAFVVTNMKMDPYYIYLSGVFGQYILRVDLNTFTAIDYINHDTPATLIGPFDIYQNNFTFIAKFGVRGSLVLSTLECPNGTYSTDSKYPCTPCIAGTYSTVLGSNSSTNCINCPTGYYSTVHLI